jgi:hypothetical protein
MKRKIREIKLICKWENYIPELVKKFEVKLK